MVLYQHVPRITTAQVRRALKALAQDLQEHDPAALLREHREIRALYFGEKRAKRDIAKKKGLREVTVDRVIDPYLSLRSTYFARNTGYDE